MMESSGTGHMCFCEEDMCNAAMSSLGKIDPSTSGSGIELLPRWSLTCQVENEAATCIPLVLVKTSVRLEARPRVLTPCGEFRGDNGHSGSDGGKAVLMESLQNARLQIIHPEIEDVLVFHVFSTLRSHMDSSQEILWGKEVKLGPSTATSATAGRTSAAMTRSTTQPYHVINPLSVYATAVVSKWSEKQEQVSGICNWCNNVPPALSNRLSNFLIRVCSLSPFAFLAAASGPLFKSMNALPEDEIVRRTCTSALYLNLYVDDHICKVEPNSEDHMCFCEQDLCNGAMPSVNNPPSQLLFFVPCIWLLLNIVA
ncbi:hypothetical protein C0J52_02970 [Blattella germanica]|nr:hypothetical protein C0J52_02970 [Blattella germanica]